MDNIIEVDSGGDEILCKTEVVQSKWNRFQGISNSAEIKKRTIKDVPKKNDTRTMGRECVERISEVEKLIGRM